MRKTPFCLLPFLPRGPRATCPGAEAGAGRVSEGCVWFPHSYLLEFTRDTPEEGGCGDRQSRSSSWWPEAKQRASRCQGSMEQTMKCVCEGVTNSAISSSPSLAAPPCPPSCLSETLLSDQSSYLGGREWSRSVHRWLQSSSPLHGGPGAEDGSLTRG